MISLISHINYADKMQLLMKKSRIQLNLLIVLILSNTLSFAVEDSQKLIFVYIYPAIISNYQKASNNPPGFIQLQAQCTVRGKIAANLLEMHMPLVREYINEFLSFSNEKYLKDPANRTQLRASLVKGIQNMLKKQIGEPLIEDLFITHLMWE